METDFDLNIDGYRFPIFLPWSEEPLFDSLHSSLIHILVQAFDVKPEKIKEISQKSLRRFFGW